MQEQIDSEQSPQTTPDQAQEGEVQGDASAVATEPDPIEQLKAENTALNESLMRALAESQNIQRRLRSQMEQDRKYAVEIHEQCRAAGVGFLDAPITGGSMGANAGTLTIFCGGRQSDFEIAEPRMQAYGKRIAYLGAPGSGQKMKVANQIAVGGALLALCESLAFADAAGLDLETTRELLNSGAAGSWAFSNYGPKIVNRDWSPGFSISNQRKDFGYCIESAHELGLGVPGTELVDQLLAQLESEGRGEDTTAALFDLMRKTKL